MCSSASFTVHFPMADLWSSVAPQPEAEACVVMDNVVGGVLNSTPSSGVLVHHLIALSASPSKIKRPDFRALITDIWNGLICSLPKGSDLHAKIALPKNLCAKAMLGFLNIWRPNTLKSFLLSSGRKTLRFFVFQAIPRYWNSCLGSKLRFFRVPLEPFLLQDVQHETCVRPEFPLASP